MASPSVDYRFLDIHTDRSLDALDTDKDEKLDEIDKNETMVHIYDLQTYQPSILLKTFNETRDQQILEEIYSSSQNTATQLQNSLLIQSKVQTLSDEANLCYQEDGSEDDWSYLIVWPMLQLAREINGLKREVRVLPLQSTHVSSKNLLPHAPDGTVIDKRIDFGLAIQLENDQISQINQKYGDQGVSPTTSCRLRTCPVFCSFEVKKLFQQYDPLVQLGVWTSAIYARWEQIQAIQNLPPHDLPVLFGWTITGHLWLFYVIRRLPDGTRQITHNFREYSTRSSNDIYLILATLCELMHRGNGEFRTKFSASILNSTVLTSASTLSSALAPIRASLRRKINI